IGVEHTRKAARTRGTTTGRVASPAPIEAELGSVPVPHLVRLEAVATPRAPNEATEQESFALPRRRPGVSALCCLPLRAIDDRLVRRRVDLRSGPRLAEVNPVADDLGESPRRP